MPESITKSRIYIHLINDSPPFDGAFISMAGMDGHCLGGGYADCLGEVNACLMLLGVDDARQRPDCGDSDALRIGYASGKAIEAVLSLLK